MYVYMYLYICVCTLYTSFPNFCNYVLSISLFLFFVSNLNSLYVSWVTLLGNAGPVIAPNLSGSRQAQGAMGAMHGKSDTGGQINVVPYTGQGRLQ